MINVLWIHSLWDYNIIVLGTMIIGLGTAIIVLATTILPGDYRQSPGDKNNPG